MFLRFIAIVAIVWIALMPPLFTDGACTAEFEAEARRLQQDGGQFRTPELARTYWSSRGVAYSVLTLDQCRRSRPRYVEACGRGPLVVGHVPVKNTICRIYRDDEVRVQLQYDDRGRLDRMQTDMSPFRSLPIPFTSYTIHWAR